MKRLLTMLFVMAIVVIMVGGCAPLTETQRARLNAAKQDMTSAAEVIADARERICELDAKLDAVVEAIKAKELPVAEGKALYDDLMANKEADRELIKKATDVVKAGEANVKAVLAEAETQGNKGRVIWELILSGVLAAFGVYTKVKLTGETAKKESCISGIEKSKSELAALLLENGVDIAVVNSIDAKRILTKNIEREAILSGVESSLHADVRKLT